MKHNEENKPEKEASQRAFSLDRERRRIKIMKLLFACFAISLVVVLVLSMALNR